MDSRPPTNGQGERFLGGPPAGPLRLPTLGSSKLVRSAVAPVLVSLALLLWDAVSRYISDLPIFITFYPAVMLSAIVGGFYPGLLAILLSVLAVSALVLPRVGLKFEDPLDLVSLTLFAAMGLLMCAVARRSQRAQENAAELTKELAVRETTARLRLALQAADAGLWEWDLRTNANFWSDEVWPLYGLEPHSCEPSYENWRQTVVPEDRARAEEMMLEAARQGTVLNTEWRVRKRDGSLRWLMSRGQPVRDDAGQIVRYMGIVVDITARKVAELELREADKHRTDFLAILSHELRNPLAPIRNSLFILERAIPGSEQALRAQGIINRQVGHLGRLIDDLLDVTRITRGKIQLQRECLDLQELAVRTAEDLRSTFAKNQVRLEVLTPPGGVRVNGDQARLAQVLGNLLQNSAKFTEPGGQTTVEVGADDVRRLAVLTVRDTGRGIAPEVMPRLFAPFAQADATLDRTKGGLGLGLALVKGLVEMHGGTVRGESEGIGKGATFTICLPLAPSTAPTAAPPEPPPRERAAPGRVLIIEDNSDTATTLREALELGSHEVAVASNGPDGIEKARAFRPDVVICDIGLPEMDGYEVARRMRADPALRGAGFVALTGYAQPEDVEKAQEAGFDAHVAKPPNMEALEGVLVRVGRAPNESRRS